MYLKGNTGTPESFQYLYIAHGIANKEKIYLSAVDVELYVEKSIGKYILQLY